jgi:RNA polymerase sigma factor for flagellar operon FliA
MDDRTKQLWRRYKLTGDESTRNEIVLSHLPLVRYVLGRLPVTLPAGLSGEDLASVGVLALLREIEDFDPERGVEFATFAVPRLRGAMLDELRAHDIVPRSVRQRASAIEHACVELSRTGKSAPSLEEIAHQVDLAPDEVERTLHAVTLSSLLSLEAFQRGPAAHGGRSLLEAADARTSTPLATLMAKERDDLLARAIASLPEAERRIIVLYYQHDLMLKEIAEVLSVTKSRVSQLHARALFRLRAHIAALTARRTEPQTAVS